MYFFKIKKEQNQFCDCKKCMNIRKKGEKTGGELKEHHDYNRQR